MNDAAEFPSESEEPEDVQTIIHLVRQSHPTLEGRDSERFIPEMMTAYGSFWLTDEPGDVQIESSFGRCPFLVETDKHSERFTGQTAEEVAAKIVKWLRVPGRR